MCFFKPLGRGVLCSEPGWNVEYLLKYTMLSEFSIDKIRMKFQEFLNSGVFACKLCSEVCQGHENLIRHYEDTHGMRMKAKRLLR